MQKKQTISTCYRTWATKYSTDVLVGRFSPLSVDYTRSALATSRHRDIKGLGTLSTIDAAGHIMPFSSRLSKCCCTTMADIAQSVTSWYRRVEGRGVRDSVALADTVAHLKTERTRLKITVTVAILNWRVPWFAQGAYNFRVSEWPCSVQENRHCLQRKQTDSCFWETRSLSAMILVAVSDQTSDSYWSYCCLITTNWDGQRRVSVSFLLAWWNSSLRGRICPWRDSTCFALKPEAGDERCLYRPWREKKSRTRGSERLPATEIS